MITILEAGRAGLFGKGKLIPNIVAGVIVGVVALPLAMAFAIASGAKPEQGIYTAIIGGFMVSVLGGSRVQIAGPTGAFIAILSGVKEGDLLITSGQMKLKNGSPVHIDNSAAPLNDAAPTPQEH